MTGQVASTSWQDSALHLRVYKSDGSNVTEMSLDSPHSWTPGKLSVRGSSVCATSWVQGEGNTHIRIYVSDGGKIIEHCNDGNGWVTGATIGDGIDSSATSYLSDGGKKVHIRVYVQGADNTLTEYCYDDGVNWYKGKYKEMSLV